MYQAIKRAKDHINLETYIFRDDEIGRALADLLIARQRAGVQVNVIYDAVGPIKTPGEFFARMQQAGINVLAFNPSIQPRRASDGSSIIATIARS